MANTYTAIIKQDNGWWIGWIEEVPGVNCQERTREELLATLRTTLAEALARISHKLSTAAADPGVSTALHSLGLLDALSSTPAGPSVARLVSMPVCAASLRKLVRNAG